MSLSVLAYLAADMRARGLAPATVVAYSRIIRPLLELHPDVETLDRLTVSEWVHTADTKSKQRHRYLAVNALCRALVEDGTLASNPCDAIKMPIEPVSPQPTLSDQDYASLLGTCEVRTLVGKRDKAIKCRQSRVHEHPTSAADPHQ